MTYIKTLTAPLIMIAGLALLTACGGGATPDEDSNENTVDCTETPFDSPDMCEAEKNTFCALPANVFTHTDCSNLDNINDIRTTFCALPANIFDHAECEKISNINALRTTFCEMPDNRFNQDCIDNKLNDNGRMTFCELPDNRFNADCITNNLGGDGRTTFCAMPANIFTHEDCKKISNINDIRMTFCTVTEIFHASCLDDTYGGDDERDTACQTHGITEPMGDASCDGRIRMACIANPFEYDGCDTLDETIRDNFCKMAQHIFTHAECMNINNINNIRNTYCSVTEIFHASCLDDTYDGDDERDNACLTSPAGDPEHPSCANRPGVILACTTDPFLLTNTANTGCENLDTIVSIRDIHCGTSANFEGRCTVNYDDWKDSFNTAPIATPNETSRNEFLNAGDDSLSDALDEVFPDEHAETAKTLNLGELKGGDATDGVAYFVTPVDVNDNTKRYYYAGLASGTDLGAPSFQKTGTATWDGKFQVLIGADDALAVQDFELTVNFETKSITSLVQQGNTNNYFYLNGVYDSNGVIDGTVNYTKLLEAITDGDRTTIMNDPSPEGILTGLIGKQGAIGAFVSGTAIDSAGVITGGTSATDGFAGGFVANPFEGNVSYSDWASSGQIPAATANTANPQNELLQTTRNDLNIGTITGAVHVNLATATYEDVALGGSATNGFTTGYVTTGDNYYAGITSTTNLGEALVRTTGTGAWKGSFVAYEGGVATTTDFELMIEFAATSRVSATIGDYAINITDVASGGTFTTQIALNRQGVTSSGALSGIIGQKGAVGVFRSDSNADVSYAGGFVAAPAPCVLADNCMANHAAWVDSFGASPPPATRAESDAGTNVFGGFLNLGEGVRDISPTSPTSLTNPNEDRHLTLDGDGENGMHGVTYLAGRNGTNNQAFVAVLPTTNLGAPLVGPPAITAWPGKYYNRSLVRDESTTFEIKFGEKTITSRKTFNAGFSDITTIFALNFTETGVITGTVSEGGDTATARGLIGIKGLVGVFVNATPNLPDGSGILYGGFIADNPNN